MAVIQDLPQEILDRIISLTAEDGTSWQSPPLALVHPHWVRAGETSRYQYIPIRQPILIKILACLTKRHERTDALLQMGTIDLLSGGTGHLLRELFTGGNVNIHTLLLGRVNDFPWDALHFVGKFNP